MKHAHHRFFCLFLFVLGLSGCLRPNHNLSQANLQPINIVPHHTLKFINEVRATGRLCGDKFYPAAPPLRWNYVLQNAAQRHAQDMAQHNYFEHQDKKGNLAPVRAKVAGYASSYVGENLGAGYQSTQEVMHGWLASPKHCANLMQTQYQDVALAFAYNPKSNWQRYWVLNLGAIPNSTYYIKK